MKKITITIALMLVVALAMPVFGASFSDVPSDHWSYDAINKLVAAGIVEGYPDGEFKGEQSMTRYEMAVMVSRALDNIVDEMEAMNEGLSTGQAEDVTAIVKSLMEKNSQDELSDAQAEEVADIVDALTFELRSELKVLGAEVDALGKDVEELEATVAEMDVPEDNIEFTMDVTTQAEVADYGENTTEEYAALELLEDGDAVDEVFAKGDYDEFVSKKAFFQEWDFGVNGELGDAEFNLAVDTIANVFTEEKHVDDKLAESETVNLEFDSALLEVAYNEMNFKMGDMDDYVATNYFLDDPDVEGIEMTTSYMDNDIKVFAVGEGSDSDNPDRDYFGATIGRDMDFARLTGKVFYARDYNVANDEITTVAVQAEDIAITEDFGMGAEVAFSDDSEADSDVLARVNGDFTVNEDLTVNGLIETVGEDFTSVNGDLEEAYDYDMFNLGAEYGINENNTVNGAVTMIQAGDVLAADYNVAGVQEDKFIYELGLENTYGKFTNNASVEFTQAEDFTEDHEATVIVLGTEYAWNETLTLGAELTNKTEEVAAGDVIEYNYLTAFANKELAENISWNNEVFYMDGTVGAQYTANSGSEVPLTVDQDGTAMGMTSSLSVSF
jgi:polyhydroxyalkanoate synthesis regulator phasin